VALWSPMVALTGRGSRAQSLQAQPPSRSNLTPSIRTRKKRLIPHSRHLRKFPRGWYCLLSDNQFLDLSYPAWSVNKGSTLSALAPAAGPSPERGQAVTQLNDLFGVSKTCLKGVSWWEMPEPETPRPPSRTPRTFYLVLQMPWADAGTSKRVLGVHFSALGGPGY